MIHSDTTSTAVNDDSIEYLPARMLNEFVYCPRLFFLEHVEGLFAHNADTLDGAVKHKRVDKKTDALAAGKSARKSSKKTGNRDSEAVEPDDNPQTIHARSVTLSSDHYGIIAKMDLVQATGDLATPVDYKRGSPKTADDGSLTAWDPEKVQVCAQALVLRENGYRCDEAVIYFQETRQRVRIPIDDELIELTRQMIEAALRVRQSHDLPPPLSDSPKCPRCSLVSICLPDETSYCASLTPTDLNDQTSDQTAIGELIQSVRVGDSQVQPLLFNIGPVFSINNRYDDHEPSGTKLRQLITPRDERKPLYLNTQGYSVGVSHQVLQVKEKRKVIQKIRLHDISQVNIFGNIQLSTQAISALLTADIPVIYFSFGGWFKGMTQPVGLKNIMWRREQFRSADRPAFCLNLAQQLVVGKIRNQRTMLMRNHVEPPRNVVSFMKEMAWDAGRCNDLAQLLGVEGIAARCYFENFNGMLKTTSDTDGSNPQIDAEDSQQTFRFDFKKRNRRPPRDPVNALLSLGYSVLSKDMTIACASVGLDPYLGFYHQPRFGRPALALDLMEPFRPLIVDSTVLSVINQQMVTERDFVSAGNAVALTASGRRSFFQAYEQRMNQIITHPLFGYRVSYRRLLEIQVRLLARVLLGEIRDYPVFTTR